MLVSFTFPFIVDYVILLSVWPQALRCTSYPYLGYKTIRTTIAGIALHTLFLYSSSRSRWVFYLLDNGRYNVVIICCVVTLSWGVVAGGFVDSRKLGSNLSLYPSVQAIATPSFTKPRTTAIVRHTPMVYHCYHHPHCAMYETVQLPR